MMVSSAKIPKVSVCVITYNQENYIATCLESILSQQTNFDYDLIIGEDCSTDATALLIQDFKTKHKNIKLLDNATNVGVLPNFIRTLKACRGDYIAFCEGDDYWIDEHKLQKQVDFLEEHPQYGGVCGEIISLDVEASEEKKHPLKKEGEISFEDIVFKNRIHSNTIVFRRELINAEALQSIKELSIGDWYLHLLVTKQKPYYYLQQYFALYRVHSQGVFSKRTNFYKAYQKSKLLLCFLKNEATKEDLILVKKSLQFQILSALKASSKADKKELKALFCILKDEKLIKINRSLFTGIINLIK